MRIWLTKLLIATIIIVVSFSASGAQLQLFGVSSIDGELSVEYENVEERYNDTSSNSDSTLAQKYMLSLDTFILHPNFLTWDVDGEFGVTRSGDDTTLTSDSYGTSIELMRRFFLSAALGLSMGTDEVAVPYSPSYTRDREEKSAAVNLRIRHFPTSFTFKEINLMSDSTGHEQNLTEQRIGIKTNLWLGRNFRGTFRVERTNEEDKLAQSDPTTRYYNATLSNSWNTQDRNINWNSNLQLFSKQLPESAQTISLTESVNYLNEDGMRAGGNFSFSKESRDKYEQKRMTGGANLNYQFSEVFTGKISADVKTLEHTQALADPYSQNIYELSGQASYRSGTKDLTYYATGTGGITNRIVEGEGSIYTSEILTFNSSDDVELSFPYPSDIEVWDRYQTRENPYPESSYTLFTDSEGYVTIHRNSAGVPPEDYLPDTVLVIYSYTPDRDDKLVSGDLKLGLDKKLAQNVTLTSYVSGGMRKSLANPDSQFTKNYQIYLGSQIAHDRLRFTGSVSTSNNSNKISGEAKYNHGTFDLTGTYVNEFASDRSARHNLAITGRYYAYIPIGVRLTIQGSEKRVYQSGQLVDGSFDISATGRYPLKRYMWLTDELKFNLNHKTDNGIRWSNSVGFEWRQGMLSLNSGYEIVSNQISGYLSHRVYVKASRRF